VHHVLFGHIGDCHLHFNFITASEAERIHAKELYSELAKVAISMGGTISGEHGVGKKTLAIDGRTMPYLELMYGKAGLEEIARVKSAFDPKGLLNAGNMLGNWHSGPSVPE
jgi:D-lactate dehydrogenase (cytochrome)